MARARLLRQYVSDYQKRVGEIGSEYQAQYAAYSGKVDAYNRGAEQYNAVYGNPQAAGIRQLTNTPWIKKKPWQNTTALLDPETGKMYNVSNDKNQISGMNWLTGGTPMTWDQLGKVRPEQGTVFSEIETGTPEYAAKLAAEQKTYDDEKALVDVGAITYIRNPVEWEIDPTTGKTYQNRYAESGRGTFKVYTPPTAPTTPAEPEMPSLNLTERNKRELQNPSQDVAGIQMAANMGIVAKSELADNEKSKTSAFADPDDPNNLKDLGILARTLGGQL